MKFKIGDTVRVVTERWGKNQFGMTGVVYGLELAGYSLPLPVKVKFDNETNAYDEYDLEIVHSALLLQPDFTLDEIASAQEIMDQMG